jgi:hypothetical protein
MMQDNSKTKQTFSRFLAVPGGSSSIFHNVVLSICEDREYNLWSCTVFISLNKVNPENESFFS